MKGLERLSDQELLSARFCDLPVAGLGDLVSACKDTLDAELASAEVRLSPHVWLSDEWFCPDGVSGFAVPVYLAHPRLRRLERKMMLEVEGGTKRSCLRLMRHEAGHAIDNAYRLRDASGRKTVFGSSATTYPDFYAPLPFSKKFVRHLPDGYAQSHPDEDFAETFAVWLDPDSDWRARYAGWGALEKLELVDALVTERARKPPSKRNDETPDRVEWLTQRLRDHYEAKRERYRVDFKQHYDEDLNRLFSAQGGSPAAEFLRRHRTALRAHVARWTRARRYTVDLVLGDWIDRARETRLYVGDEDETMLNVATALTVRLMQYLRSGHYRVAL